jgi:hypothetical protein
MPRKVPPTERLPIQPDLEPTVVGRCCEAWYCAYEKAAGQGRGELSCGLRANAAYRAAMPPLTCAENVPGFVACVAHGLLLGTIVDSIATRLFHAAQVVSRACKSSSSRSQAASRIKYSSAKTVSQEQAMSAEIPHEEGDAPKKNFTAKL